MTDTDADARPLALVTGASSGIGFELAKQFAEHGYDLVVAAEDADITHAAAQLEDVGVSAQPVQVDLAHAAGVEELWKAVQATGRPVDAVAFNAGVGVHGPFVEIDLVDDLRVVNLNVTSVVHLAKAVVPQMAARGEGRVLITSSIAATMPGPFYATYAASKSFLLSFAEALRNELQDTGVTVTALLPGPTDTDFFDRADMDGTRADEGPKDDAAEVARQGFEAMLRGEERVVAGSWRNKVQSAAARLLPDQVKAALHRFQNEPG